LEFKFKPTQEKPGLYATWMVGALGYMLAWMERVRSEAHIPPEFACAVQLVIFDQPIPYIGYGRASGRHVRLPEGIHEFPLLSVGPSEEFATILHRFDEDLWNLGGRDVQREQAAFSFTPAA
jgi:hypothetical protein